MGLNQDVKQHEKRVLEGAAPYTVICRRCCTGSKFVRHDVRRRTFCGREGNEVITVRSWIARWTCTNCLFRFTDYPPFALPNKQFTKATVFELVGRFVNDFFDRITYRSTPLLAPHIDDGPLSKLPVCSHATVWRWMSWLDELREEASLAMRLLDVSCNSTLHRCGWAVQPWKYRSNARRIVLRSARRSLHIFDRMDTAQVSPKLEQAPP
jgi:hypothetical protein